MPCARCVPTQVFHAPPLEYSWSGWMEALSSLTQLKMSLLTAGQLGQDYLFKIPSKLNYSMIPHCLLQTSLCRES